MHNDTSLQLVIQAVSDIFECDPSSLSSQTRLMQDLPCESIDLLEIASRLAQTARIQVNDDSLFLRSLRTRIEEYAGEESAAVIRREFPWLRLGRAEELASSLSDPSPQVTLADLADYITWAEAKKN